MKIYIVERNADFTEGRGPMLLHKVFKTLELARTYVKDQEGIFGSKQYQESNRIFKDSKVEHWNGYYIKEMEVEEKYDPAEAKRLRKERDELILKLKDIDFELKKYN